MVNRAVGSPGRAHLSVLSARHPVVSSTSALGGGKPSPARAPVTTASRRERVAAGRLTVPTWRRTMQGEPLESEPSLLVDELRRSGSLRNLHVAAASTYRAGGRQDRQALPQLSALADLLRGAGQRVHRGARSGARNQVARGCVYSVRPTRCRVAFASAERPSAVVPPRAERLSRKREGRPFSRA